MPNSIKDIIYEFAKDMYHLFGTNMSKVMIYGSYARGDYSKDSDIDVMILVKISEDKIRNYTDDAADCAFEYMMKYGIDISPVVKNEEYFNYWVENPPYYRNIRDEGVIVNAG